MAWLCWALALLVAVSFVSPAPVHASAPAISSGPSSFTFDGWEGPDLPVWVYAPESVDKASAPIAFIMHGARRDPDRYRDQWIEEADKAGFIIVAPGFSREDFPRANGYNLGGVFDGESGEQRDERVWAFSAVEPIFDEVVARLSGSQSHYTIYGHSAGSQFVHRFLFFKPDARVKRYLAANAGWYTFADPAVPFPFGLKGLSIDDNALKAALAKDVVVILGDQDNDPGGRLLNQSKGAMKQGPHRFARGKAFFASARSLAERKGWEFGWSVRIVEGVGHSNGGISDVVYDLIEP